MGKQVYLSSPVDSYRIFFEDNPQSMWLFDPETLYFVAVNDAAVARYGYSREEFLAKKVTEIRPPDDAQALVDVVANLEDGPHDQGVWRHFTKDGRLMHVEINSHTVTFDGRRAILVIAHDITQRQAAEEALRESEEHLRLALDAAQMGTWDWDAATGALHFSPGMERLHGCEPGTFGGSLGHFLKLVHEDDRESVTEAAQRALDGEQFDNEYRVCLPNGSIRWLAPKGRLFCDAEGRPVRMTGVSVDITDKHDATEALNAAEARAVEEQQQLLYRLASVALALGAAHDLTTVFRELVAFLTTSVSCTGAIVALYDAERQLRSCVYAVSDGVEVDVSELPPMPQTTNPLSRAIETGEVVLTTDFDTALSDCSRVDVGLDRDPRLPKCSLTAPMAAMGRVIGAVEIQSVVENAFTQEHVTVVRMAANLAAVAVENVRLFDRQREQEEQLRTAQRMEAVGRLAGGVAHDFNNLLTVIGGYSSLVLKRLHDGDPLYADVVEIRRAADRAATLTRQLLAFSRKQILEPRVLSLNAVVTDMEKMLGRLIGEDVSLVTDLDPELNLARFDPGQIEQVIANLAVNARDAMPRGGTLTIATRNTTLDEAFTRTNPGSRPGDYVVLTIRDTGCGMDEEIIKHVFEPFFTTKEVGTGTGLGLSTVYGIVKQSDGYITVDSRAGEGSVFTVYLPRVDADASDTSEVPTERGTRMAGTETVLLVEDEDAVRAVARESLTRGGFRVLEARHSGEALMVTETHPGPIHLLVTDIVMPNQSGPQLAETLTRSRPQMKVLYMSGYTRDLLTSRSLIEMGASYLAKPFTPDTLVGAVRAAIDADPSPRPR